MREHRYIIWDKKRKEWLHDRNMPINLLGEIIVLGAILLRRDGTGVRLEELNDLVVCEYIGSKDKEGREIYCGDIVKAPSSKIFKVIWHDEEMRIALESEGKIYNFNVPIYELVGSVHENKELLK